MADYCIAFGMEWYPLDASTIKWLDGFNNDEQFKQRYRDSVNSLNNRKNQWNLIVQNKTSFYDYHKQKFYNDRNDE